MSSKRARVYGYHGLGAPVSAGAGGGRMPRLRLGYRKRRYDNRTNKPPTSIAPKFYVGPDRIYVKEKFFLNVGGSQAEQISTNTGYDVTVRLADMAAAKLAAYKALYSAYQITGVKVHIFPRYSSMEYNQAVQNAGGAVSFSGQNTLAYVSIRTDDTLVGSNYAGALLYSDVKVIPLKNTGVKFFEKLPTCQLDVNPGGAGTDRAYQNTVIDIEDDGVVHKAGTFWMESEGSGTAPFTCIVTAHITFYDSR